MNEEKSEQESMYMCLNHMKIYFHTGIFVFPCCICCWVLKVCFQFYYAVFLNFSFSNRFIYENMFCYIFVT